MPRGGKRPGAGRKVGSRNKATLIAEAREREIVISGKDPLDYMLEVMRNPDASWRRRDEMAKAAAPYLHARLAAVEYSGTIEQTPVERLTDDELARRIAELNKAVEDDAERDAAPDDPSKLN
jgi:hypothetical protein